MIWQLDLVILTLVIICAIAAISIKDLLGAGAAYVTLLYQVQQLAEVLGADLSSELGDIDIVSIHYAAGLTQKPVAYLLCPFILRQLLVPLSPQAVFKVIGHCPGAGKQVGVIEW